MAVAFGVRRFVDALLLNVWLVIALGLAFTLHHHGRIVSHTWAQVLAWAGGAALWIVLTFATFVYGAYYLGRLILRGGQHPVVKALLGGLILIVALQVPWLNVPVWLAMVFFGLGAQLLEFWTQRPWQPKREADVRAPESGNAPIP